MSTDSSTVLANWTRNERRIFKPRPSKDGACLKLQLRLDPKFGTSDSGRTYVNYKESGGGLFLDIVPQAKQDDGKNARFEYESPKVVTAALGIPDISGML